jgi:predicted O-linked N-acetylglucosamine transferase (SPINDLY family)
MNKQAPPRDLVRKLQQAVALHRQGRLDDAERVYREILLQAQAQPDALHFLGVIEGQRGRHHAALSLMDRSIAANPRQPAVLYNRANLLREMGQFEGALSGYDAALAIKSDNLAALNNRGAVLEELGRHEEAIASFDHVLALKPDHADALVNRGNALVALSRSDEALASYDRALQLAQDNAAAIYGKANALAKLGRNDEALAAYDRALELSGANPDILANRGGLLGRLNRVDEALNSFARAIAAAPRRAEIYNNRAIILMQASRFEEALHDYDHALALKPGYEESLYGRGSALIELNRHDEAIAAFQDLVRRNPGYPYALGMLVFAEKTACDWRDTSAQTAMIEAIRDGKRAASLLALLAVSDSPTDKLLCSRILMRDKYEPLQQDRGRPNAYGHERIRVGYLSADFRTHPVAMLMAGVFEHHDRKRFETIAFSYGVDDASPMRTRLMRSCERFLNVRTMSDAAVASLVRENEIDILVDLTGLTASARPGILALRPAPVQVNYLGFAGTMGASFVDYIIADAIVIPEAQQAFYTEKVAYLPHCYLPHDSARRIAPKTPTRTQAGLPERGFVFASFNNSYKFSPLTFDIWMRLLKAVDGSVLWLSEANSAAVRNLRREAEARGVDSARLVFAPRLPAPEDHLARLGLTDLFLDTLPYNAHTTAMDALWAGLPVLTSMGDSFASRVAASLLCAAGLPELVAASLERYEEKALMLARDPDAMSALKAKLAAHRASCPLFDTERFTRNLERAYRSMWLRAEHGQPSDTFHVEEAARP